MGNGDCGFGFERGASYLVFAGKEEKDGSLSTGICSGTALLEDSAPELRLLRGEPPTAGDLAEWRVKSEDEAAPAQPAHKVCGKVSAPPGVKAPSIKVIFWRAGQEETALFQFETAEADIDGSYCIDYLDPGKYLIGAIQLPRKRAAVRYLSYYPGVAERSQAVAVTVATKGKTVRADFPLLPQPLYQVRGYLRGAPEKQAQPVLVMLMSAAAADHLHFSEPVELGPHGFFEFQGVSPGHYTAFAVADNNEESLTFLSAGVEVDVTENVEGLKLDYVAKK
jgi:hypothetical protein